MVGLAYEIELKDKPIKLLHHIVARKTPFPLRDGAKAKLDRLVVKGIP